MVIRDNPTFVQQLADMIKNQTEKENVAEPARGLTRIVYFGDGCKITTDTSTGTAMTQVRTTAELAAASMRKDPATSPTVSNVSAIASDASDAFPRILALILLFLRSACIPINAGTVKYVRPISELATSPAITIPDSGVALNREYVNALTLRTPRSG